jgi:hypothetical protein
MTGSARDAIAARQASAAANSRPIEAGAVTRSATDNGRRWVRASIEDLAAAERCVEPDLDRERRELVVAAI